MTSFTDRNTIVTDKYQFYFNKLLTSKVIDIQKDVLTKELVRTNFIKYARYTALATGFILWIHEIFKTDTTVKTVARAAT